MALGKVDKKWLKKEADGIRENQEGGGGSGVPFYQMKKGKHTFRMLPPWRPGVGTPILDTWKYFKLPPDDKTLTALKTFSIEDDPIQAALSHMRAHGADIGKFQAKYKGYIIGYVRKVKDGIDDLRIIQIPWTVRNWLILQLDTCEDDDISIADLYDGMDIQVDRSGDGLETKYICTVSPNRGYIGGIIKLEDGEPDIEAIQAVEDRVPDLNEIFKRPTETVLAEYAEYAQKMVASRNLPPLEGLRGSKRRASSHMEEDTAQAPAPRQSGRKRQPPSRECYGRFKTISKENPDKCDMCPVQMGCKHES